MELILFSWWQKLVAFIALMRRLEEGGTFEMVGLLAVFYG